MTRSMTGFASTLVKSHKFKGRLSIRTYNHRYFDWVYNGPEWGNLEFELRSLAQRWISRGRIEVWLELCLADPLSWEVEVEEGLIQRLTKMFKRLEVRLGQPLPFTPELLFRLPQAISIRRKEPTAEDKQLIIDIFTRTLGKVVREREREGEKLRMAIQRSLSRMKKSLAKIKLAQKRQTVSWREQVRAKVGEILRSSELNQKRLEEEVAYLLLRSDITEEMTRIEAHLESLAEMLASKDMESKGRQIDFLAQELWREISTLNSKSANLAVVKEGLQMKTEVESIRQQCQNIE